MTELALYQLAGSYRQLAETLADGDFDAQTISDTIESSGIVDALQDKAQGVELVARAAVAYVPAIDAEIARLQALKERRQKIADGLREYVRSNMIAAGIDKIDCPLFTLKLKKNPPAVEVLEEDRIPSRYWVSPPPVLPPARIDKKAIAAALKAGTDVPGARLTQATRLEVS